jgi:uncharacterized damage-inducible protein DinB
MTLDYLQRVLVRDLNGLKNELDAYPDEASLWATPDGITNSGGTLALHLVGNIRHFIGAILGTSDYVRDREAEFSDRGVTRAEIKRSADAAIQEVEAVFESLSEERLAEPFPAPVGGEVLSTGVILVHFAVHFGFHLGQLDYHRRLTTGVNEPVRVLRVADLGAD